MTELKNMRFFPFQRNSYFTGKLLTVRDFKAEQQYINDKRRLINRFLAGIGVVCGMEVTRLDGSSIIIESGLALDGAGREIVIDRTLIKRLSDINGFGGFGRSLSPHVYLCIEYSEEEKEPMHGIADNALAESNYNRIEEGFRLFLTYDEPISSLTAGSKSPNLESELSRRFNELICLARIELIRWESAYEIGYIEPSPFGQLVKGLGDLRKSILSLNERVGSLELPTGEIPDPPAEYREAEKEGEKHISSGSVTIAVPKGGKAGQAFFSDEIPHGLGSGETFMTLGLSTKDGTVFGCPSVFRESADYEFAARVNNETGTFQAGVMLKRASDGVSLRLVWTALREKKETSPAVGAVIRINLQPGTATVKPGCSLTFKAEVLGLEDRDVKWSVIEKDGGHVDSYGCYTAPDREGVYAIRAASAESPELYGMAYVVVKK